MQVFTSSMVKVLLKGLMPQRVVVVPLENVMVQLSSARGRRAGELVHSSTVHPCGEASEFDARRRVVRSVWRREAIFLICLRRFVFT